MMICMSMTRSVLLACIAGLASGSGVSIWDGSLNSENELFSPPNHEVCLVHFVPIDDVTYSTTAVTDVKSKNFLDFFPI